MQTTKHWRLPVVGILLVLTVCSSCRQGEWTYDALFLEVRDPERLAPQDLLFFVIQGSGEERRVAPRDPDSQANFRFSVAQRDLEKDPFQVRLVPGKQFRGEVQVVVLAGRQGRLVGRAAGQGNLGESGVLILKLEGIDPACDQDGDGFSNCQVPGCCRPGETFADCDDRQPAATPVGYEDSCSHCDFLVDGLLPEGAVDDDCDGSAAACMDDDGDQSPDCIPSWCREESLGSPACLEAATRQDCDPQDGSVFPGTAETCDEKDNDCDGLTDEDLSIRDWNGTVRLVGEPCGTGRCAGGNVVCDLESGRPVCSTAGQRMQMEDCLSPEDDNCNGVANDPVQDGCFEGDLDGDGVADELERQHCPGNPDAPYDAGVFPELEFDGAPRHASPEPCCLAQDRNEAPPSCDRNCDGIIHLCAPDDRDGDGYPDGPDTDCDDLAPTVHAGAWERCGDGIDQDCRGGDIPCEGLIDADRDGYSVAQGDCNDSDVAIHPSAPERCNGIDDDCDGYTDEGNPEAEFQPCGSDIGECRTGRLVCVHARNESPSKRCIGAVEPVLERCNGRDDDCDGKTDEEFAYDPSAHRLCLDPGESGNCIGFPRVGERCAGRGTCGDADGDGTPDRFGIVFCLNPEEADCSTNPGGPDSLARAEVCNALDDDCDGSIDEDLHDLASSDCRKVGVCQSGASLLRATCEMGVWRCDYSQVPDWDGDREVHCDGLDNDCDGSTDEDFTFQDETHVDPLPLDALCGKGVCEGGRVVCLADQTGLTCSTYQRNRVAESCDDLDNDCDGLTDEDFGVFLDPENPAAGRRTCRGVGECAREEGHWECLNATQTVCSTAPGGSQSLASIESCNSRDDDCDGQTDEDLTDVDASTCRKVGVCGGEGKSFIQARCDNGTWTCNYSQVPHWDGEREVHCDHLDNDCDGQTDEDFVLTDWDGTPRRVGEGCGTGLCAQGTAICSETRLVCSTAANARPETCDGRDENCDGQTDEDQFYQGVLPGGACSGVGECARQPGVVECHPVERRPVCSTNPDGSASLAGPEFCNGRDDDCNGLTDDGLGILSPDCPCLRTGVCVPSQVIARCTDGEWLCDYRNVTGYQSPREQTCDDLDNDCDGMKDEDFTFQDWNGALRGIGETCGTGRCWGGVTLCRLDQDGLECSTAGLARSETCNGVDDDCDGLVDEFTNALCSDGLDCTEDQCLDGGCRHQVKPGSCLIQGVCHLHQDPHPSDPCLWCDATRSPQDWSPRPDSTPCNADGDGCTEGDSCQNGACVPGAPVVCPSPNPPCKMGVCVSLSPQTYACQERPSNLGGACNDADPCSYQDRCQQDGVCRGTSYSCADGRYCTVDTCDGLGGCQYNLVPNTCLLDGICRNAGDLNPLNLCQVCDPTRPESWSAGPDHQLCDDRDPCTLGDECLGGTCVSGVPRNCDDGNPCTEDSCDSEGPPQNPCVHTDLLGAGCNDLDLCTYTDVCKPQGVCAGTPYSCTPIASCYVSQCLGLPPPNHCSQVLKADFCFIANQCWANGQANPSKTCQVCDVSKTQNSWTIAPGTCYINQTCYTDGDRNPANQCQGCQSTISQISWRNLTGLSCDDGRECTTGDQCLSGSCVGMNNLCSEPNPSCSSSGCVCQGLSGSTVCDPQLADHCDGSSENGTCMCGGSVACTPPKSCTKPLDTFICQ